MARTGDFWRDLLSSSPIAWVEFFLVPGVRECLSVCHSVRACAPVCVPACVPVCASVPLCLHATLCVDVVVCECECASIGQGVAMYHCLTGGWL